MAVTNTLACYSKRKKSGAKHSLAAESVAAASFSVCVPKAAEPFEMKSHINSMLMGQKENEQAKCGEEWNTPNIKSGTISILVATIFYRRVDDNNTSNNKNSGDNYVVDDFLFLGNGRQPVTAVFFQSQSLFFKWLVGWLVAGRLVWLLKGWGVAKKWWPPFSIIWPKIGEQ